MHNKKFYIPLVCLMLLIPLAGLWAGAAKPDPEEEAGGVVEYAVDKEYDRGPVKFYLKVDKKEITIAEKLNLLLEVIADTSYEVAFPVMDGQLTQFSVRDIARPPAQVLDEKTIKLSYTYQLEPFLSGDYSIPPLTFRYWEAGAGEDEARLLETDEVQIKVTSILPEDREKVSIQDIIGPVPPPARSLTWLWILLSALVVGGGATVLIVFWVAERRRKADDALYTPAHEIAFRQLRKLVAQEYVEKQEYKLFYIGISNILRHYVENRFGLQAPESTTEEFLEDLQTSELLLPEQKAQLRQFLSHCDLVKFAELIPSAQEIQQTFDICKNFILQTQAKEVTVEDTGDTFKPESTDADGEPLGVDVPPATEAAADLQSTQVPGAGEVGPPPEAGSVSMKSATNDTEERGSEDD